jgi:PAS domain S-box-containing protein
MLKVQEWFMKNRNVKMGQLSGKRSLTRIMFVIPFSVATIAILSLALYYILSELIHYKSDVNLLKKEFPIHQRHELRYRILGAKDYIHFVRTHRDLYINSYVNRKMKLADSILSNGIGNSAESNQKITPFANDSLTDLCKNSVISLFITDMKGKSLFSSLEDSVHPIESLINGKVSLMQVQASLESGGWPGVFQSLSNKLVIFHDTISDQNVLIHACYFLSDSVKLMQELVLDSLHRIRYDNDEYIFINTYDGKGLITKGKWNKTPIGILEGKDQNWKQIFKKELEFANKPSGDYLTYNWQRDNFSGYSEKVSYISGLEDWKWILGTGMHTNDIEPLLKDRKAKLKATLFKEMLMFTAFLIILLLLIYFIARFISNLTASNIKLFARFLKNAAISLQPLDESEVHFKEFLTLAKAANHMIKERDRIKTDLATEQSRLKYIIDSIPDLIFFKDINSNFVGGNRAFEKFIGKKSSEIIGCSEFDLFSKSNAMIYVETDKKLLETKEPIRSTEWTTYPDGRKILCDTLKTLYYDADGNVLGFIGISRDITEMEETRQRLIMAKEKAEESDRLKTAFLANMSHEIRTPMNAIIGFSDLLSDEELDKEDRADFISKIKLSGESLMNIINDIIDIAKIEAGQLKITDSECNIDKLLNDLFGTFFEIKNKTTKTDIELKLSYPDEGKPLLTITDPLRLQQVLTNLLSNALKFTEFGVIEFGYSLEENNIHFFVRDTGIGILRSKQALLFQRFSQVDPSNTRKYGGTGLGLAISKNIVELMGGQIWLESEPGQGSTFHFTIPQRIINIENINSKKSDTKYDWHGKTILIAEDIEQNYLLMEAVLRFTQVSLLHAPNGQVAIDLVRDNPGIHLVLMDIQLPVKTGYEAIAEILQIRPELPIVSFTAYALPREREKSIEAGCVDYMNKPIKPEQLLTLVKKYIL